MALSITINSIQSFQVPLTWEAAIIRLQNEVLFGVYSLKVLSNIRREIYNINFQFGTDIDFKTVEDGRIILFSRSGEELIIPEALTRRVLFEKTRSINKKSFI